ncbi:MAG: zinc metallopeptidase [Alphaproteobacteria bacterium]|nr:zinc metallopeptidase [Alphaproteobacteria bacterium]MBV9421085.1 zinc metallopeptidase [Alphaproteobacteria bacterium]MBV9541542.1 zinc metallopeptidase [Alphaproteobacteria bacterium]MBV9903254.1 zinc metallopeptidase [Alphaproteobacteria bacterium]
MRLDDLRSSSNVEDRRGGFGGGGIRLAGGGGLAVLGFAILAMFFGVDPTQILNGTDTGAPTQRSASDGPRSDDAAFAFSRKIIGSAEDVWKPILEAKGITFTPATFTVYDYSTPTACGQGESSAGPFYCPGDNHIYIDLAFYNELADKFGAPGQFAEAYVIAHEYGHHIQNLMGTSDAHADHATGAESDSVRMELQADCYAGVWAKQADRRFHILESGDVEGGLRAASAVGDDTLEKQSQGYAVPDSFTHGTSEQRMRWFKRGLDSGSPDSCDTFSADSL